jgi:uncharacterized Zn-finger protein
MHVATVHRGEMSFKCEICLNPFARKVQLTTHVTTVHLGEQLFKCDICLKLFAAKDSLYKNVLRTSW